MAAAATLAAALASLATSEDCGVLLVNEGRTALTPATPMGSQRFRVIGMQPSSFKATVELHGSPGASVRAALVPDEPSLFRADGGPITNAEVALVQSSTEPATATITLPDCAMPGCENYAVRLDLESASSTEVAVHWTVEVRIDDCRVEGDDEYIELRRE